MDTDGLTDVDFTYQWLWVDADGTSNEEDITGEIAATYTLTDRRRGQDQVKVKVSFTDELSGVEERTSDAYPSSGTVLGDEQRPGVQSGDARARNRGEHRRGRGRRRRGDGHRRRRRRHPKLHAGGRRHGLLRLRRDHGGQIRTKSGVSYDHEAKASYTVTVTASDGTLTTDASVTISVTDVDEPPSAPATPTISAVSGSTTSLSVSWAAPANAGKPPSTTTTCSTA